MPKGLKMTFVDLQKTYGWTTIPSISKFPITQVDFSMFGLEDLTALSLHNFQNKLAADNNLTYEYLIAKLGFDI